MEVLLIAAVAATGALATWVADRRRARRRNDSGQCASCAEPWTDASRQDAYLIHGRLVCEGCAVKAKRRLPWELGAIGAFSFIALASATAAQGVTAVVIVSGLGTAGMLVGAVQIMKLDNRRAQRRLAGVDEGDVEALTAGEDDPRQVSEGPDA